MDIAQNIIVIKTVQEWLCNGCLLTYGYSGIVGCITVMILCVVRSEEETPSVMDNLNKLINSNIDN